MGHFTHTPSKVCCIGAGFVGGPTGAIIAYNNPHVQVTVADLNTTRIAAWKSDTLPLHEPGLSDIISRTRSGPDAAPNSSQNLHFTTETKRAIAEADIILLCVNTPPKVIGAGAGAAPDLSYVELACLDIAEAATSNKIIVEKSTVPVRTAEFLRSLLSANSNPGVEFEILSNPEFLAEGTAIHDLMCPDRVLIGSMPTQLGLDAAHKLADLYSWVPRERIVHTDVWSSELAKLASNALLAQRISSINSLSAICEATGASVEEIAHIVGLDTRIGPKMLKSSVGFGGSCFQKDVLALCYLAESLHLPEVAAYWRGVIDVNDWQKHRLIRKLLRRLNNTLNKKTISVLGFAYKKNTSDARESPAILTVKSMVMEGAYINIYDPKVTAATIRSELLHADLTESQINRQIRVCDSPLQTAQDASAVVILTDWDEFCNKSSGKDNKPVRRVDSPVPSDNNSPDLDSEESSSEENAEDKIQAYTGLRPDTPSEDKKQLDWSSLAKVMKKPLYVLDGRNIVDPVRLEQLGFKVENIGNAGIVHAKLQ